jgi:hypothetical protein
MPGGGEQAIAPKHIQLSPAPHPAQVVESQEPGKPPPPSALPERQVQVLMSQVSPMPHAGLQSVHVEPPPHWCVERLQVSPASALQQFTPQPPASVWSGRHPHWQMPVEISQ